MTDHTVEVPEDCAIIMAHIEIIDYLTEDGKRVTVFRAEDQDGELPELVNMLGMLEMSKDTAFRMARGEWPFDGEDEEDEEGEA